MHRENFRKFLSNLVITVKIVRLQTKTIAPPHVRREFDAIGYGGEYGGGGYGGRGPRGYSVQNGGGYGPPWSRSGSSQCSRCNSISSSNASSNIVVFLNAPPNLFI